MKNMLFSTYTHFVYTIKFLSGRLSVALLKCFFLFLIVQCPTQVFAQTETIFEILDKKDELKTVCWPSKSTAKTDGTTNQMETDDTPGPSPSSGGPATPRRLLNAVLVPNSFPDPDTAEIFDLLGNTLIINGSVIMFDTSSEAALRAQTELGGGGASTNYHWVGYKSNLFQPDNVAVYVYNIFHRWYNGMPCHYENFPGRQWNGDNSGLDTPSDTTFDAHPVEATILQPVSCYGGSNGVIKVNANPLNYYTFSLNNSTPTLNNTFSGLTAGTYTVNYTDSFANSCDTFITLPQPASSGSSFIVSSCGVYNWAVSGINYNVSGTYFFNTITTAACPKQDTLILNLSNTTSSNTNVTSYNFYIWPVNGQTYTQSGTYLNNSVTSPGCTTFSVLNLTIINSPFNMNLVTDQPISCFGNNDGSVQATAFPPSSSYIYFLDGGIQINNNGFFGGLAPGTYTICVSNGSGSPAVCKTITLISPPQLVVTINADSLVSCLGNDGGLTASVSGGTPPYDVHWTNAANLTISTSYTLTNRPPGLYKFFVVDDRGCMSMMQFVLTPMTPLSVTATAAPILCNGGTTPIIPSAIGGKAPYIYTMFNNPLATAYPAGTYTIKATDAKGCTATTIIDYGQPAPLSTTMSATACNSYYWSMNASTYTQSGYYVSVLTTLNNCTIISLLDLTINNATSSTVSLSACNSYTWPINSQTYTLSGNYTATSLNAQGCLHTTTLNLTMNQSTVGYKTAVACNTYNWSAVGASNPYTISGTYTATSLNAAGCLRTDTLYLTINNSTNSSQTVVACNSYNWPAAGASNPYTVSGTYTATSINASGCLHTATLLLTINQNTSSTQTIVACNSYNWTAAGAANPYSVSGTYTATSINAAGCLHTATLLLTINQSTSSSQTVVACNSYNWPAAGASNPYTVSGIYTATSINAAGCLSTSTLNLTINNSTNTTQTIVACNSYNWTVTGAANPYTVSGTYTVTSLNASGCVHTSTLLLTIHPSTTSTTTVTANNGYQWTANNTTYTVSGNYTTTLPNAAGCDSILTLNLTINQATSTLTVRCFIEGYMEGPSMMKPVLANQFQPSTPQACDTIRVELHSPNPPYAMLYNQKLVLTRNGFANCSFAPLFGNYYIVVRHRNTIQTWSSTPVFIGGNPVLYNFTTGINQAYGENQVQVSPGVWAFYNGDINTDENIDLVDIGAIETDIVNYEFGYIKTDINGDGSVDLLDIPIVETNITNYIFSHHP